MAELEPKPLRPHDAVRFPDTIESLAWECEQDRLHKLRDGWDPERVARRREERLERACWMIFGILIFVAGMIAQALI